MIHQRVNDDRELRVLQDQRVIADGKIDDILAVFSFVIY